MSFLKKEETVTVTKVKEKKETKMAVIIGKENGLIPYHMACVLMTANEKAEILLIDNSVRGDVFQTIPKYDEYAGSFYETTVLRNRIYSPEAFSKFDYVIVYLGLCVDKEYIEKADAVYVISDYTKESRNFLVNNLFEKENKMIIFTDKVTPKISEKAMVSKTNFESSENISVIEMAEEDLRGYIEWSYNGDHAFSHMSKDYQDALATMVSMLTGIAAKDFLKR